MGIPDYLDQKLIIFLHAKDRNEALSTMVETLDRAHQLQDKEAFYSAILEREKIVSTGVGLGVAIPHAKLEGYDHFFIAIGIQKQGPGIEWQSLDGAPVKLIFMIGGPDNRQMDYLKILSSLTAAVKDPNRRKALLAASTPQEVLDQFTNC